MPPRLDLFSALRIRNATPHQNCTIRPLSFTPSRCASTVAQKRRRQDPYALAQARARKQANLSRQDVLRTERAKAYGNPIRGLTTPFIESFDTAQPLNGQVETDPETQQLNYFLNEAELQKSLQHSNVLTTPIATDSPGSEDPMQRDSQYEEQLQGHANAREALSRIVGLANSSSRDRTHANIQRCIETFGRHNTDRTLRPNPSISNEILNGLRSGRKPGEQSTAKSSETAAPPMNEKTPRAGPDTGSSEVQIAVLTAKIRTLANFLDTRGRKDKANQRNLRLLVHKRQKLLRYMRKKERGGERWQHLVQTLGLSEGTWRGEITV